VRLDVRTDIGVTMASEWSRLAHMIPCSTSHALSVPAAIRRSPCRLC